MKKKTEKKIECVGKKTGTRRFYPTFNLKKSSHRIIEINQHHLSSLYCQPIRL